MADEALRRTDELLTELVEHVETARTVPMSSSIVLPRERVLDLLDELREVLPPEMHEARKLMATRDQVLHDAHTDAVAARDAATAAAELILADARGQADRLIAEAEVQAYEIVEAGKAEHAQLVSATGVHQAATARATELRAEAEAYLSGLRDEADRYHETTLAEAQRYGLDVRTQAEGYAAKLTADSEAYADRTLADLSATLQRAAATADQGRHALAARRPAEPVDDLDGWQDAAVPA
jgi:cell division septum initiation protein DivIVA